MSISEHKKRRISKSIDRSLSTIINIVRRVGSEPLEEIDANALFSVFISQGLHGLGIEVEQVLVGGEGIVLGYGKDALEKEVNYELKIGALVRQRARFQIVASLRNGEGEIDVTGNYYLNDKMKLESEDFVIRRHPIGIMNKLKEELREKIPSKSEFYRWLFFYVLTRLIEELAKKGFGGSVF